MRVGHRQLSIPENPLSLIAKGVFFWPRVWGFGKIYKASFLLLVNLTDLLNIKVSVEPIIRSLLLNTG